jgi:hypothetical protein
MESGAWEAGIADGRRPSLDSAVLHPGYVTHFFQIDEI